MYLESNNYYESLFRAAYSLKQSQLSFFKIHYEEYERSIKNVTFVRKWLCVPMQVEQKGFHCVA